MTFTRKLKSAVSESKSTLCVGLDPNLLLLPEAVKSQVNSASRQVEYFLKKVIDVTADNCAAYKPNLGFFEALGADGWDVFKNIVEYIPSEKIIIADAKRGDISSTAEHYAEAFFGKLDVDAVTLNPLMGFETLNPFLKDAEKGAYVLTLTSNAGAKDILLQEISGGDTISAFISKNLRKKQQRYESTVGMVVGATQSSEITDVIKHFKQAPLLIPGVGKQGGSAKELAKVLKQHEGIPLINSSRSVIYAGSENEQWEHGVAKSAKNLQKRLEPITKRYV